jgi:hypothetical protein
LVVIQHGATALDCQGNRAEASFSAVFAARFLGMEQPICPVASSLLGLGIMELIPVIREATLDQKGNRMPHHQSQASRASESRKCHHAV